MSADQPTTNWTARAACKWQPGQVDLWFSTNPAHRRLAAHICLAHCPVFVQCDADRKADPCGYSIQAGVLYESKTIDPRPIRTQPNPDAVTCPRCDQGKTSAIPKAKTVDDRKPPTLFADCGTPKAYKRHTDRRERPDDACRAAHARSNADYHATAKGQNTGAFTDNAVYQARVAAITQGVGMRLCDREIGERLGISAASVRRIRVANRIPAGMPVGGMPAARRKGVAA